MTDWEKEFDRQFRYCIEHSAMEHNDPDHIGWVLHDDAIKSFIRKLLKDVIGEDEGESGLDMEEDFAISWVNAEKAIQRKRAGI